MVKHLGKEEAFIYEYARNLILNQTPNYKEISRINWDKLFSLSKKQKLISLLEDIQPILPNKYQTVALAQSKLEHMMVDLRLHEYKIIEQAFKKKGIEIIWIKGIPLSIIVYGTAYARKSNDMDFLISPSKIEEAYQILKELGYLQEAGFDFVTEKYILMDSSEYKFVGDYHEIPCIKEIGNRVYLKVELKRASSAVDVNRISDFYLNTMDIDIGNTIIQTSDYNYTFIHLCANTYGNCEYYMSKPLIRDFIDICIFYLKYKSILVWDEILEICRKNRMTYIIFWVMQQTNELWGIDFFANHILERYAINDFPTDDPWKEFFNKNGSMNNWKSPLSHRILCWDLHCYEQIRSYKEKLYSKDRMTKTSYDICLTIGIDNWTFFHIKDIPWKIEYKIHMSCEQMCIIIKNDDHFKNNIIGKRLEIVFFDNNFENNIYSRTIQIQYSENSNNIQITTTNINISSSHVLSLDSNMLEISINIAELDMDWHKSGGFIFYNLIYSELIDMDTIKNIQYLSGNYIPKLLKCNI